MRKVITFMGVVSLGLVLMLSGCGTKAVPTSTSQKSPSEKTQAKQPSVVATPIYKRTEVITSPRRKPARQAGLSSVISNTCTPLI